MTADTGQGSDAGVAGTQATVDDTRRWADWPWLLLIAGCALAIRLAWMWQHGLVIENEGAGYARLAENLLASGQYVSTSGGRNTLFPPLYPMAIAMVTWVSGNSELAARLVSCVTGVLLVWPVYGIARYLGDRATGLVAAILVAGGGVLVALSGSAYSESSYFLVFAGAIYFACRVLDGGGLRHAIASGVLFGLAYLVRPEAGLFAALAIAFIAGQAVAARWGWRRAATRILALGVCFALLAAPWVAWLSVNSGYLRVEGKSLINGIVSDRISQGLSYQEASYGIGPDLAPLGPYLVADQFDVVAASGSGAGFAVASMLRDSVPRTLEIVKAFGSPSGAGGPVLALFTFAGLVASLASRRALGPKLLFAASGAAYVVILLSLQYRWDRFMYPLTFMALPWAANGIAVSAAVAARVLVRSDVGSRRMAVRAGAAAVGIALIVVPSFRYAATAGEFAQSTSTDMKAAGQWLRDRHAGTVMGMGGVVPYYAGATFLYLPYATGDLALRYIHELRPDYIYLRNGDEIQNPYIEGWLAGGIPDSCAVPAQTFPQDGGGQLAVWKWTCD